ncbi:G-box-binding factor 1-like [Tripterygium wilfordii]|uniref:G-box-binding factor 1-like n=1 Tax=Tripterygium wilfordii TaxID=458696 RepID=A0A7J7CPN1_TRIWF|nr:G-box-binding factor 1-like [Tripterygium wilfordii]XP_038723286.1 G-box-binding factor 1-like [Tripterygium wilfordii]KAF5736052.1 G-box-binding factor 1-like [Tripterygium wilfordii]
MGTGEEGAPAKASKPASSTQEIPTTPAYPDWSNSMQAYYGAGATPPPFFASTVASPTPHPYIWGGQHSLLTPYGTPVPYPALYPPGGVYAHPNMAMTTNPVQTNTEPEAKGADGKDRNSAKTSKGTGGGRAGESGKVTSGSGNDGASQSNAESGSEDSSDTNDENNNHQEYGANKKGSFDQMLADANAQNSTRNIQASVRGKPVGSMPATNLNIGMDYWNPSSAATGAAKVRPNPSGASTAVAPISSVMPDNWVHDEREMKKQKRKQSNRESARRSRLRKQAECEELQAKVETLNNDNHNLKDELKRLSEECGKLTSENNSIKEELVRLCGPEALENLEQSNNTSLAQCRGGEGNS